MKVKDGRGLHRKKLQATNIKKVEKFFEKHLNATIKDCCDATGISRTTVSKIVRGRV